MKIREKYTEVQIKAYYKKLENNKITALEFLQIIKNSVIPLYMFRYCTLFVEKQFHKFDDESMAFFIDNFLPLYFNYGSYGKSERTISNLKNIVRDKINIFVSEKCCVSDAIKYKFIVFFISENSDYFNQLVTKAITAKNAFEFYDAIVDKLNSYDYQNYEMSRIVRVIIEFCKRFNNESVFMDLQNYIYQSFQDRIILSLNNSDATNYINVYFNKYIKDESLLYEVTKNVINRNLNERIKDLIKEELPFGMCVKAFIETLTDDIVSLEPDMVERLNESIVAYKMLKKS